jgi:hypothetical protein
MKFRVMVVRHSFCNGQELKGASVSGMYHQNKDFPDD